MQWKLGWKTLTGALSAAVGIVSDPTVLNLLPHKWAAVLTAVGTLLGAVGIRAAVAKGPTPSASGTGYAPAPIATGIVQVPPRGTGG